MITQATLTQVCVIKELQDSRVLNQGQKNRARPTTQLLIFVLRDLAASTSTIWILTQSRKINWNTLGQVKNPTTLSNKDHF